MKPSFASDNYAPVHPFVMEALIEANHGHVPAYGNDQYTQAAIEAFKDIFGADIEVFFVYNGTGANTIGLTTITRSYHGVLVANTGHINVDECGAPEKFTGCKLLDIESDSGKLTVEQMQPYLHKLGEQHHSQPRVISITQGTEYGTVYSIDEIQEISDFAKQNNLLLHMDGARIANAVASQLQSIDQGHNEYDTTNQERYQWGIKLLKGMTKDAGVDVLSFGGTKNGMMFGEAVIFFNTALAHEFRFFRKQGMQLHSKMRYIGAQFQELLKNHLWLQNSLHANAMAQLLANQLRKYPKIQITQPVQANVIFATIPQEMLDILSEQFHFYVWNPDCLEVRWMTSFDTTVEDIQRFIKTIADYYAVALD
ncbi:threonine aldolase [Desulfuribacillus stibiiarsenatis]|uniref:Threonine aldolase n=1 Tax=Desulfuribacillus stibiiarsenatis TaxID=1390249 RepID=A0A1E5L5E2_9FIRM|nr:low specificity L-threonine aldolase [Desulfuribacillus stibiiarsenatis]OEH85382.1 threonine aldolase [Desulfuribacillus stibiiarsenatis]